MPRHSDSGISNLSAIGTAHEHVPIPTTTRISLRHGHVARKRSDARSNRGVNSAAGRPGALAKPSSAQMTAQEQRLRRAKERDRKYWRSRNLRDQPALAVARRGREQGDPAVLAKPSSAWAAAPAERPACHLAREQAHERKIGGANRGRDLTPYSPAKSAAYDGMVTAMYIGWVTKIKTSLGRDVVSKLQH